MSDASRGPRAQGTARAPIPYWLGRVFEPVYAFEIGRRNRRYDRGKGVRRVDRPTISVGNLTVGGTGKTPTVKAVVRMLIDAGRRPCVAMRGYKSTPALESDEAGELRRAFPSVPVVAKPDRATGLVQLFSMPVGHDIDTVVLDDGFQHRRLARDLDIVLIDATRDVFADRLLPAGWLREPVASLRRAGVVVLTHAESVETDRLAALQSRVAEVASQALLVVAAHRWSSITLMEESGPGDDGRTRLEASIAPADWLTGRSCLAVCAIGNPGPFLRGVRQAVGDGRIAGEIVLPDHDGYPPTTVDRIIEAARRANTEAIVTTEKDWTKLARVDGGRWPCTIAVPRLEMVFDSGGRAFREAVVGAAEVAARGSGAVPE